MCALKNNERKSLCTSWTYRFFFSLSGTFNMGCQDAEPAGQVCKPFWDRISLCRPSWPCLCLLHARVESIHNIPRFTIHFSLFLRFILFYLYECFACVYVFTPYTRLVPEKIRRGHWIPWILELQINMNHHVGGGNQTLVFCKSNKWSLFFLDENTKSQAEEVVQWLRVLDTFPEGPQTVYQSSYRESSTRFRPIRALVYTQIYMQSKHSYTQNKNKSLKERKAAAAVVHLSNQSCRVM